MKKIKIRSLLTLLLVATLAVGISYGAIVNYISNRIEKQVTVESPISLSGKMLYWEPVPSGWEVENNPKAQGWVLGDSYSGDFSYRLSTLEETPTSLICTLETPIELAAIQGETSYFCLKLLQGDFSNGSPRLSLGIDTNNDGVEDDYVYVYPTFPGPQYTWETNSWDGWEKFQFSDIAFEVRGLVGQRVQPPATFDDVKNAFSGLEAYIVRIYVVVDVKNNDVLFDAIVINGEPLLDEPEITEVSFEDETPTLMLHGGDEFGLIFTAENLANKPINATLGVIIASESGMTGEEIGNIGPTPVYEGVSGGLYVAAFDLGTIAAGDVAEQIITIQLSWNAKNEPYTIKAVVVWTDALPTDPAEALEYIVTAISE